MKWTLTGADDADNSGSQTRRLHGHQGRALGALWLQDGRILSWGGDWTLRLWDADTGALLRTHADPARTMSGHGGIRGAQQLPNGRILSWGFDGIVHVWELDQILPVARIAASTVAITGVLVVDDLRFISWSGDGVVRLCHLDDPRVQLELPLALSYDGSRALVPPFLLDGTRGLVAWDRGELRYVSLAEGGAHAVVPFPSICEPGGDDQVEDDGEIVAAVRLASGELVAFGRAGGIRAWSLPELTLVREFHSLPAAARGACALADGRFATWYAGRVAIYGPGHAEIDVLIDPPADGIIDVTALHRGGFACRSVTHRLMISNHVEQRSVSVPHWREPVNTVVAPNDDLVLWSPRADGILVASNLGDVVLSTEGASINHVALHPVWPEVRRVLASVESGEIFQFDVTSAARSERKPVAVPSAVHGLHRASEHEILACHQDGELSLHSITTGARTRSMRIRARTLGAASAPGNRLVTWEAAGSIHVWSVDTGDALGVLAERDYGPLGPTVVLDSQRAVSWSSLRDRVGFLLWHLERVAPIAVLGGDDTACALGAAPLGAGELVTWSELPYLRRWDAAGHLLETIACGDDAIAGGIATPAGIVTWTDRGHVSVWSPGRRPFRTSLRGTSGAVLTASANGEDVLFLADDGALVVWRPASPRDQCKLDQKLTNRATEVFALSGGRWIVLDDGGGVSLCSRSGVHHRSGTPSRTPSAAVSDNKSWLAMAEGRELRVFSIAQALVHAATLSLPSAILALHPALNGRFALGLGDGRVVVAAPSYNAE